MKFLTNAELKSQQEDLQRRILELIQNFELKTDWRVQSVTYDPVVSKLTTVVKKVLR